MLAAAGIYGQSRGPEFKIPVPLKNHNTENAGDTTEFDERPYFLLIGQSEQALENQDYEAAGLRLVEAMGMEPDNPLNVALLSNLGIIYFYQDKDSLALEVLDKVIERSPRLVAGHENKARVLTALRRDREAYDEYAAIIAIDSLNTNARYYHGMMALYGGDRHTAETDFAVLERVIPKARITYTAMGTLYSMTGREREAIHYFRKLIEVEPAAEYYASLAGCYLAVDDLNSASETLGRAMERYPDDPELYYYRAWLNRDRYEYDAARADADRAIKLGARRERVESLFRRN